MKSTSPDVDPEEGEERSAGFVLFRRFDDRRHYLLLRHRNGGHWAFPKGRIEPGEDELETARREVEEETGIDMLEPIPGFREVSAYRFDREGRTIAKTVVYFLAGVDAEKIRLSSEHADAAWLDADGARKRLTYAESRRILDRAEARLIGSEGEERSWRARASTPSAGTV